MEAVKANYTLVNYAGTKHSFTNPDADKYAEKFNIPLAYNPEADKASWLDLQTFLKEIFN